MKERLSCFTPEVMLATFIFEIGLAVYVFFRYTLDTVARIALLTLLALGIFQGAEFLVCTGQGDALMWARTGFVAITFLPAFGIHMTSSFRGRRTLAVVSYLLAAGLSIWILLPGGTIAAVCHGNYVVFDLHAVLEPVYATYYFGLLGTALYDGIRMSGRAAGRWFTIGYASFLIPMGTVYVIERSTFQAIPSIMCGFAVIYAAILAFKVVPHAQRPRSRRRAA